MCLCVNQNQDQITLINNELNVKGILTGNQHCNTISAY